MLQLTYNKCIHPAQQKVVFLTVFCLLCISVVAQNNILDYQNKKNPLFYNPAFNANEVKYEFSVLPLSATSFELSMPLSLNDIFTNDNGNNIIDMDRLYKRAGARNTFLLNSTVGVLRFSGQWYNAKWGFQIYENIVAATSFQKNVIELINKGNGAFIENEFSTNFPISLRHYNVWQVSYSRELSDNLSIGAAAKLYFGKSTITSNVDISILTDPSYDFIDIGLKGKIRASGPIKRSINWEGYVNGVALLPEYNLSKYLFEMRNPGLGIDFGIDYKYNSKLNLSASILDLGFISWFSNINSVNINGIHRWKGFDLSNIVYFPQDETVIEDLENISIADSIVYSAITPADNSFITSAPTKVYLAAYYKYNSKINLSVVNRLTIIDSFIDESFLISGDYAINNKWSFSAGLNITNRSYFNIPVGISFKNDVIMFSVSTNNLWGLALSSSSRTFGGSVSLAFIIDASSQLERDMMKVFPFFRPYKRWQGGQ